MKVKFYDKNTFLITLKEYNEFDENEILEVVYKFN